MQPSPIKIALVDDHKLFRKGMIRLINAFPGYTVVLEAGSGLELIEKLSSELFPDIALLDITMPNMDGYQTAQWLKKHHPQIKVLALSMYENEQAIIKMLKAGAKGYLLKDAEPEELQDALWHTFYKGFYHSDLVSLTLLNNIGDELGSSAEKKLTKREIEFLQLICSELTYKEVADQMGVVLSTVDGYREALFYKLKVKSRTGLVLYAIKSGIAKLD